MNNLEIIKAFIADNCDNVRKLRKQMTDSNIESLLNEYTADQICSQLANMENYRPLTSKYTSVYLTIIKWFRLDEQKNYKPKPVTVSEPSPKLQQSAVSEMERRRTRFLFNHPVGSEYISTTGTKYIVDSENFLRDPESDSVIPINIILRRDVV